MKILPSISPKAEVKEGGPAGKREAPTWSVEHLHKYLFRDSITSARPKTNMDSCSCFSFMEGEGTFKAAESIVCLTAWIDPAAFT